MPSLLPRSFEKLLGSLPDWRAFASETIDADVCVLAVGFEDRSCAIVKAWAKRGRTEGRNSYQIPDKRFGQRK